MSKAAGHTLRARADGLRECLGEALMLRIERKGERDEPCATATDAAKQSGLLGTEVRFGEMIDHGSY